MGMCTRLCVIYLQARNVINVESIQILHELPVFCSQQSNHLAGTLDTGLDSCWGSIQSIRKYTFTRPSFCYSKVFQLRLNLIVLGSRNNICLCPFCDLHFFELVLINWLALKHHMCGTFTFQACQDSFKVLFVAIQELPVQCLNLLCSSSVPTCEAYCCVFWRYHAQRLVCTCSGLCHLAVAPLLAFFVDWKSLMNNHKLFTQCLEGALIHSWYHH